MNDKCNSFTFFKGNYLKTFHADRYSFSDDDVDYKKMYTDIAIFISLLIRNGQQVKICSDEYCVIVEYNDQDEALSGVSLEWIGENEFIGSYDDGCEACDEDKEEEQEE